MRFKYRVVFFVIIFILFMDPIYADTTIALSCPTNSTVGSTISCDVFFNSDVELSAISTKLRVSGNLELVNFTTDTNWQGTGDDGKLELYTSPSRKGTVKLGVASIKVLNNNVSKTGTIFLDNTTFYLGDFSGISGNSTSVNLKILSTNNNLANITLNKGSLSPSFDKNVFEYQAIVDSDNVIINVTLEDSSATVSGGGVKSLKDGKNVFVITVISESGEKKEYKINITKPLKNEEKPSKGEDDSQIKEDNKPIKGEDKPSNKVDSSNQETSSSNQEEKKIIKLKDLVIDGYEIDFNADKNNYSIDLIRDEDELNIMAIPNSDNIKVTISGNSNLKDGANEIKILLEDDSGNKNTYIVVASMKGKVCLIKDISIEGYSFDFNCDKYEYSLEIKEEDNLNIEVIPIDKKAIVNIYDNNNLKNNSIITILVKVDENEYKYLINIIKEEKNNINIVNNRKVLTLIGITIFSLMYLVGRFIIKKKKSLNNKK